MMSEKAIALRRPDEEPSLVESNRGSVARRSGAASVVAGTGAHLELGAVLRLLQHADLHGTERSVAGRDWSE